LEPFAGLSAGITLGRGPLLCRQLSSGMQKSDVGNHSHCLVVGAGPHHPLVGGDLDEEQGLGELARPEPVGRHRIAVGQALNVAAK
jgi:hypothetical protein